MPNVKSTIFLILLSTMILGNQANAGNSYSPLFNSQYPNSPLVNSCSVCHNGDDRNDYSQDWALAGKDFTAIENLDSDGDGIINVDEINAGTHPGVPAPYSYYMPYFNGDDHWTGIGLRNCSPDTAATVTAYVYDSTGNILESNTISIAIRGNNAFLVGDGQPNEGWVRIYSTQPLVGLCFVSTNDTPNYMADIPFASELSTLLYIPYLDQGPLYDSSVLVCNPNPSATTVKLTFVDQQGTLLKEKSLPVSANGSLKYELDDLLGSSTSNKGSLEISAPNGLVAFILYNNLKTGNYSYAGISAVIPP